MTNYPKLLLLAAALQVAAAGGALAASPPAAAAVAAPASDDTEPQSTTATYGDWTLRCVVPQAPAAGATQPAAAPAERCEIDQAVEVKGQAGPVAQIAVGSDPVSGVLRLVAQVPVGVWLPAGVKLHIGAGDPLALAFKRCLPGACLADTEIPATLDAAMRAGSTGGLTFQMVAGKDITVPMSFKGYKAAADALAKAAH